VLVKPISVGSLVARFAIAGLVTLVFVGAFTAFASRRVGTEQAIDEAVKRALASALGKGEDEEARKKREKEEETRLLLEREARYQRWLHPVCSASDANCRFVFKTRGETPACYQVDQRQAVEKKPPFNDTPFWIMSVEPAVIKDHGDIWNLSFVEMLGQLMAPRGFFDPGAPRMQLRADAAGGK